MKKKSVKPITARQIGELARLLEERGCDGDIFQRTMVENPDGLCFFLRGKFSFFIKRPLMIAEIEGCILEIERGRIVGIASCTNDYAMGNIFRLDDKVRMKVGFYKDNYGKVIEIKNPVKCTATKETITLELNNGFIMSFRIQDVSLF
jgi:hypothetical protein